MQVEIIIKEMREKQKISLQELSELTGIERHRLSDIENHVVKEDKILFIEMLVIATNMGLEILDLYRVSYLKFI